MWHLAAVLVFALWQAPDYASEGLKALDGKNYEAAAQLFAKAIEADPKDYAAHFNLGLAYSLLNKNAEAIEEYRRTLVIKPDLYEAELNLGILLLEQKQPGDAIWQLLDAVARKPAEFRPNFYLAEAYLAAGNPGRAEEAYKKAGELNPKSAAVQLGLGRSRARQDRLAEGAANFRQAAELDPDYKDALLELATLYEKSGRTPEAIETVQAVSRQCGGARAPGRVVDRGGQTGRSRAAPGVGRGQIPDLGQPPGVGHGLSPQWRAGEGRASAPAGRRR